MWVMAIFRTRDGQREPELIQVDDKHGVDVIAASPVFRDEGTNARRVVLRRLPGGKYVVHWQQFPTSDNEISVAFSDGNYEAGTDLRKAWWNFIGRATEHITPRP